MTVETIRHWKVGDVEMVTARRQGVEPGMTAVADHPHAPFEHRRHQPPAVAEVVLGGGVVALASGGGDVAERHGFDAAFGEQALRRVEQGGAGGVASGLHSDHGKTFDLISQVS